MQFSMKNPPGLALCDTCENLGYTREHNGQLNARCGAGFEITGRIAECSSYSPVGALSRYEMQMMAYRRVDLKNGDVKFLRPDQKSPEEEEE